MRAAEDNGVDTRIPRQQTSYGFVHKPVGAGTAGKSLFHDRNPHGCRFGHHPESRMQFFDFNVVASGCHRARSAEHAHYTRPGQAPHGLGRGTYDTEHTAVGRHARQIALLDITQSLGGGRVARKNHERASHSKKPFHGFKRETVDGIEGACAVRSTRVIAKIYEIGLRERPLQVGQHA